MTTTLELNPIPEAQGAVPPKGTSVLDVVRRAVEAERPDVSVLTSLYLKLRAGKEDLSRQLAERTAPINEGMDLIESYFLSKMLEMGVDSLKNENGTPYKTERVSVTVADNAAFVDFVLDQALSALPLKDSGRDAIKQAILDSGHFSLIEARASKSAVEAFIAEGGELPPGLNRRVEAKVNVRAS